MKKHLAFMSLLVALLFALAACAQPPTVPPTPDTGVEDIETPTEEMAETPTEEMMETPTEEATEEATPEATEETTEEATPEATEETTEEATPEATEETTEEATPEATEETTEEATEEPTEETATPEAEDGAGTTANQTIAELVSGNDRFTTLTRALEASGLADTLQNEGPFTVFAPTDEAFARLGQNTINALLADPETLSQILIYHAVEGERLAADVVGANEITTVQGDIITVTVDGDTVTLNDSATVIETDMMASNGVVHIIDNVLLPPDLELP